MQEEKGLRIYEKSQKASCDFPCGGHDVIPGAKQQRLCGFQLWAENAACQCLKAL